MSPLILYHSVLSLALIKATHLETSHGSGSSRPNGANNSSINVQLFERVAPLLGAMRNDYPAGRRIVVICDRTERVCEWERRRQCRTQQIHFVKLRNRYVLSQSLIVKKLCSTEYTQSTHIRETEWRRLERNGLAGRKWSMELQIGHQNTSQKHQKQCDCRCLHYCFLFFFVSCSSKRSEIARRRQLKLLPFIQLSISNRLIFWCLFTTHWSTSKLKIQKSCDYNQGYLEQSQQGSVGQLSCLRV